MSDKPSIAVTPLVGCAYVSGELRVCIGIAQEHGCTIAFGPAVARTIAMQLLIVADTIDRATSSPRGADTAGPAAADGGAGDSQGRA